MNNKTLQNSINQTISALQGLNKTLEIIEEPKDEMYEYVIEFYIKDKYGFQYDSVGFSSTHHGEDYFNDMMENHPDEVPNTINYEGFHNYTIRDNMNDPSKRVGDGIEVTYRQALIRSKRSIKYWIEVLDAATFEG
jgi:uncharacterized short protein YbdD (DUF466 family)